MRTLPETANIRAELKRLRDGNPRNQPTGGLGTVRFCVSCDLSAEVVLDRVKEVLRRIDQHGIERWPSDEEWSDILPQWFVDACSSRMTETEAHEWLEQWRRLSEDEKEKQRRSNRWSLDSWIYWFMPGRRDWFWWDAELGPENRIVVALVVNEWPFAWGAFRWLFMAAGAGKVEPEDGNEELRHP